MALDPHLVELLVCPACHGALEAISIADGEALRCGACALGYPIRTGIPVMLAEQALHLP